MILLISDLHLESKRLDIVQAFLHFLETHASKAEALYILGDFFEVWIGDDAMDSFERDIAQALRALSLKGTKIYLMHGNRDFLIGHAFCRQAGCTLLPDPTVIELQNQRILLMHGDSLCTQDEAYMRLRRWLRNPFSRWALSALPLTTRRKLARKLRNESKMQTRQKAMDITDVTPAEVEHVLRENKAHILIHGHTHRPAIHSFELDGHPARRIVLGDWDRYGWALTINGESMTQDRFELAT
ncbi:UDP-2,3-diacylglucosamine hydrolase [Pseudomonas duriflava]|uniref:UDP-2,3-diacylglucosamine hydrolase n=1 Tax=Pseudomonas duriflava TaxID=459528 RepID=A0A562QAM1_9PSED|nr:UDP-2,3-diacylglucosamine diphosphatase [Pseudomonas duriflava]TWI53792.1 UDP-2,3-diacylglucosamine hydrolase [Pseudomonas duriflava]